MDKQINVVVDFGTIPLIKPTQLAIGVHQKLQSKINLSSVIFKKYVLYYAQANYFSPNKHDFTHFKTINLEDLDRLFLEYVKSDDQLIREYNRLQEVKDANSAELLLKKYFAVSADRLGSSLFGILFQTSVSGLWIESLKGGFDEKKAQEVATLSSAFNQLVKTNPEYFTNVDSAAKQLQEFDEYKDVFIQACKNVSLCIEKVKLAEIWIPTRYLSVTFHDLIMLGKNVSDKEHIITSVFKHFEPDFGKALYYDWQKSNLFSEKNDVLKQAFEALRLQLYAPAITCFLTIVDFIALEIADVIDLKKNYRKTNTKMLQEILTFVQRRIIGRMYVSEFMPTDDGVPNKALYVFQIETLLQYIKNIVYEDSDKQSNQEIFFNRHSILHGKHFSYATEINAKKIVLLLDDLILLHRKLSEVSIQGFDLLEHEKKVTS